MRILVFFILCGINFIANKGSMASNSVMNVMPKRVFISQVVEHPALDATTKGVVDALVEEGYEQGKNLELRIESAQGNAVLASQIASKFVNQSPDVVVGVGTISAQAFSKYAINNQVKLVFSTVTDPLGAGLVKSLKQPGNNTSGVSNFVDLKPQLELFKKIQLSLKKIGMLYNPSEANSVSIVKKMEELCPQLGLSFIKQAITKTAEVSQNAVKLVQEVDAIFISNDNTALSALPVIIKVAQNAQIPVYVSDTDAVKSGAVAAFGPNQYEVGKQTGRLIIRVLEGADIGDLSVEFPDKTDLYINSAAAQKADLSIPKNILKQATQVY